VIPQERLQEEYERAERLRIERERGMLDGFKIHQWADRAWKAEYRVRELEVAIKHRLPEPECETKPCKPDHWCSMRDVCAVLRAQAQKGER
jgi:hypothetical protein